MSDHSLIGLNLADRFRITGVIGEGGMATVYRGVDRNKTELAVKIMNPELAKESRFVRRFRREAKAASMLKHPNTVQIVEFGVDQGYVFMVMELLQGQDLAMLLHRERKIPDARAVQIVVQVCRALSAAHEQSIVHRDLKPDNIMLVRQPPGVPAPVPGMNPTDFVKVLDFGIAKILDDEPGAPVDSRMEPITQEKSMLTRVGTIVGTPAYMAPEQGRAESVDARTDIYACGVLLYELVTGRVPFTGETPMQVVMRHVNEPPRPPSEFLPSINRELERLIMRALAKWPSERQQSAEELAFDLLALLPKLTGPATVKEPEGLVTKTLVLEPQPPAQPMQRPRPAAGAPAAPAGGGRSAQPGGPRPAEAMAEPANPFPTLNIEVPDDIFPPELPPLPAEAAQKSQPVATARVPSGPLPSTDPSPTHRTDGARAPVGGNATAGGASVVGRAPVARPHPPVPVVSPARPPSPAASALAQTLQSEVPPVSSDDDEAATVVKPPTAPDARMSLAEEAMAKALAVPAPPPANAPGPKLGGGLPSVAGPESIEPTLLAPNPGPTAPKRVDGLSDTMRLDAEEAEKAVQEARAIVAAPVPPAKPSPIPLASSPPGGPGVAAPVIPPAPAAPQIGLDESPAPGRKPTTELLPVTLPEDRISSRPEQPNEAALWKPKGNKRKLGGAVALLIGIGIGALLVVTALIIAISLRR